MVYIQHTVYTYHLVDNWGGKGLNFTNWGSRCVERPVEIWSVMSVVYLKAFRVATLSLILQPPVAPLSAMHTSGWLQCHRHKARVKMPHRNICSWGCSFTFRVSLNTRSFFLPPLNQPCGHFTVNHWADKKTALRRQTYVYVIYIYCSSLPFCLQPSL